MSLGPDWKLRNYRGKILKLKSLKLDHRSPYTWLCFSSPLSLFLLPLSRTFLPPSPLQLMAKLQVWSFGGDFLPSPCHSFSLSSLFPLPCSESLSSSLLGLMRSIVGTLPTVTCAVQTASEEPEIAGPSPPSKRRWQQWQQVESRRFLALLRCPPATFTAISRSQQVHLDLLVKMVPSITDKSARIVDTHFCTKTGNFASGSEPNKTLFWGNDF